MEAAAAPCARAAVHFTGAEQPNAIYERIRASGDLFGTDQLANGAWTHLNAELAHVLCSFEGRAAFVCYLVILPLPAPSAQPSARRHSSVPHVAASVAPPPPPPPPPPRRIALALRRHARVSEVFNVDLVFDNFEPQTSAIDPRRDYVQCIQVLFNEHVLLAWNLAPPTMFGVADGIQTVDLGTLAQMSLCVYAERLDRLNAVVAVHSVRLRIEKMHLALVLERAHATRVGEERYARAVVPASGGGDCAAAAADDDENANVTFFSTAPAHASTSRHARAPTQSTHHAVPQR